MFVSCRSMEDGQIGTVTFVDHNENERFTVQLYVTYCDSVYTFLINLISRYIITGNRSGSNSFRALY